MPTVVQIHGSALALIILLVLTACGGTGAGARTYSVSATVAGLNGTGLVLQLNKGHDLKIESDGTFTFDASLSSGGQYMVTVKTNPTALSQTCDVSNAQGSVANANILNVSVECSANRYRVGGKVSGLTQNGLVVSDVYLTALFLNAGDSSFTFPIPLPSGNPYAVQIVMQPADEFCTIANNVGTATDADITNISIACASSADAVGASIEGLSAHALRHTYRSGRDDTLGGAVAGNAPQGYLWTYDAASDRWTRLKGPSTRHSPGNYGTRGIGASSNVPGARTGAGIWIDSGGIAWVFGGLGYDSGGHEALLNDLWKFDPRTGLWIWVGGSDSGSSPAVYGTRGQPDAANLPGPRAYSSTWTDPSGNIWLFGGYAIDAQGVPGLFNDVWKFSPDGGVWTWVSGSPNDSGAQAPVHGTQGIRAAVNVPGGRKSSVSWSDANGNLWISGGIGYSSTGFGPLEDLWEFDLQSTQWTWLGKAAGDGGGATCVPPVLADDVFQAPSLWVAGIWSDGAGQWAAFGGPAAECIPSPPLSGGV